MPEDGSMDVEKAPEAAAEEAPAPAPKPSASSFVALSKILAMLHDAVESSSSHLFERALRLTTPLRRKAQRKLLKRGIGLLGDDLALKGMFAGLCDLVPEESAAASEAEALAEGPTPPPTPASLSPELVVYLCNLVVSVLLREGRADAACDGATELLKYAQAFNRRTMDALSAKLFANLSLAHERRGTGASVRPVLTRCHRTACLQHNEIGQSVLLNCLLRNLLQSKLVDQAYKLVNKAQFPESVSNNQFCRYLYYVGRIEATQLDYGDAHLKLQQALRKAPQGTAAGFRLEAQKLAILVQLLMGEIPERALFTQPGMAEGLRSYLMLTRAVREGEITDFHGVIKSERETFLRDGNLVLVSRLAHNVIKTGLRRISVSYSRIALADVAAMLHLGSARAAEFVVAKAIRDGVIDAKIEHETQCVVTNESLDIYATEEPQVAFHRRIAFCMDLRNDAVRALQYPADAYKDKDKAPASEELDEEELAKELAEMDEE